MSKKSNVSELKCVAFVDNSEKRWGVKKKMNKITRVIANKQGYDLGVEIGMIIETVDGQRYDDPELKKDIDKKLGGGKACTICFCKFLFFFSHPKI